MTQTEINDISADNSLIDPEKDRLGYASFAKYLADSICKMTFPEGFVIAVYGSWSSGKSTLLNFLVHYLTSKPDEEQPIIVPFNPWLFSGHQDITRRFFEQLQNVLSKQGAVPKGLRERIADFAKVISEIPLPYADTAKPVATLFDDKQKEASEFKEEVEDTLLQQQQRIVVTIDDIDRLPAEDIRQLLRIFKAIPNFTNVVYVLLFDKQVVIKTIAETKEISGEAYLEKMIQVAFELPIPDKTSLRRLLFEKLDGIFADTEEQFDQIHWGNIYFQGIDHFITNLRDIVHLTNTLTVAYPAVKGEVNPVDFIAIESLRVFCPIVYDTIIHNPHAFAGEVNASRNELKNLHNSWIAQLRDEDKQPIQNLLMHLFPKFKFVWGNSYINGEEELKWREQLRVCSLEIFPIYFRLTFSASELSNTQIKAILALAEDAEKFGEHLIKLANQKRLDGTTQVRAFLEQLENYPEQEIPLSSIPSIVQALFDVGEQLLCPEEESQSIFNFGNEVIISRFLWRLLPRLEEPARFKVLKKAITQGKALAIINHELTTLKEQQSQYGSDTFNLEEEWLVNPRDFKELLEIATKRQQETDTNDK